MFRRILSLLVVIAAGFGLLQGLTFPKLPVGLKPVPQLVNVQPKLPILVCPGPVFVNGGQNGVTLGSFTQTGAVEIVGTDSTNSISMQSTAEKVLPGNSIGSKNFNAVQWQAANVNQASGLSAANCVPGTNTAWLVAGDNSVGREALLVLANPSAVDATVSLQIYGTSGPIQGAGLSGISAPAGQVTVLPLSSFAPKTETFAIEVSSRGSELGIWLQQKTVRGLTPGGLDLVGASAAPSKLVDIPGLFLRNSTALNALASGNQDYSDVKPILRVSSASGQSANFTAQIQGADGSSFGNVIQGTVPAGSTRDFPLEDLTDGNYSIHISADQPVVAAAKFSHLGGSKPDFAWACSVAPKVQDSGFTTARGAVSKLSITNSNDAEVKITLNGQNLAVPANSNLVVPLVSGKNYSIKSSLAVSASQVVDLHGGVAVLAVIDYVSVGGKIKVNVR
jgi:hypothetical protein